MDSAEEIARIVEQITGREVRILRFGKIVSLSFELETAGDNVKKLFKKGVRQSYSDWIQTFETVHGLKTMSDDGSRALEADGISPQEPIDADLAMQYWSLSTLEGAAYA